MGKAAADEMILSYNDAVLRRSDLDILSGHYFLNDRIIEFYFSYLKSFYPSEDILLVPPSIAFWIKMSLKFDQNLKEFLEPLNLPGRKLVIFSVNDNEDVDEAEGGSHWSLLAFERNANVFVHHDSSPFGLNKEHARQIYKAVFLHMGISNTGSGGSYIECSDTPRQVNGYDCGLYVTAIARTTCDCYARGLPGDGDLWFSAMNERVTPSSVADMRNEILVLIKSLMENRG